MKSSIALKQHIAGFWGDHYMELAMKDLLYDNRITDVVEVGIYMGGTTARFARMAPHTYGVEEDERYFKHANKLVGDRCDVTLINNLPEPFLEAICPKLTGPTLFYFNTRWGSDNAVHYWLPKLAKCACKPVIVVSGVHVPYRPDLQYNTYRRRAIDWDLIQPAIESIYGEEGYAYTYNGKAAGAKLGIIMIEPLHP